MAIKPTAPDGEFILRDVIYAEDGIYETDYISIRLYNGIAENTMKYCKKGDLLGIKGRVQTRQEENKNTIEIITEKITFLTSKSNKEE